MCNKRIIIGLGFFILSCIAMLSCIRKDADGQSGTEQIAFKVWCTGDSIEYPAEIQCIGNSLYVSDYYGDSIIKVVNLDDGRFLHGIAPVGNGPGEMKRPVSFSVRQDSILVYSRPLMTMFSESLDGNKSRKLFMLPGESSNVFPLPTGEFVVSVMPFGSEESSGEEYRFMLLDSIGNVKSRFGTFPRLWEKEKNLSIGILGNFHQTNSVVANNDGSIAVFSAYVMSIYERKGETFSLIEERSMAPYQYEYNEGSATRSATTKLKAESGSVVNCALNYKDKIIVARRYCDSEDNQRVYFEIYDSKGTHECTLIPDVDVYPPVAITETGMIIAFGKETEEKRQIMLSNPLEI